ncbi:unnamed protein product [Cyclocybe aegerita]|uniref:Nephrocystin 3-like N-terminal domain-containing protein n=1 Tax=Cyclocybe aegerita TaxID=1973307 RepID=A0A8S0WSD0_CYCAE|nr:unnamed protein product [Cyclocybe aegerita]
MSSPPTWTVRNTECQCRSILPQFFLNQRSTVNMHWNTHDNWTQPLSRSFPAPHRSPCLSATSYLPPVYPHRPPIPFYPLPTIRKAPPVPMYPKSYFWASPPWAVPHVQQLSSVTQSSERAAFSAQPAPAMFNANDVLITGGQFNQLTLLAPVVPDFVSLAAFHDSAARFDAPKCHPNTRVAILEKITYWALHVREVDAFVLWLYGPAGSGKSAIGQTIAEIFAAWGRILASFFFFRADPQRNDGKRLVATLAYQIATIIPPFRPLLEQAVELHPHIFQCAIGVQLTKLIVESLQHLTRQGILSASLMPRLIIIDGLDECEDPSMQRQIIEAIASLRGTTDLPLKILVGSRAESQIISIFNSDILSRSPRIVLDDTYTPDHDINIFLNDKFDEIRRTHRFKAYIPEHWPGDDVIHQLVLKSSGQFIYANVIFRFVNSPRHLPPERLEIACGLHPSYGELPFAELDELYRQIFSLVENVDGVLQVLGILNALQTIHYRQSQARAVEEVLGLRIGRVDVLLADLALVAACDADGNITIFHKTLFDFLFDAGRAGLYFVDSTRGHIDVACWMLQLWGNPTGHFSQLSVGSLIRCCTKARLTKKLRTQLLSIRDSGMQWSTSDISAHELPPSYRFLVCLEELTSVSPEWGEIQHHFRRLYDERLSDIVATKGWLPLVLHGLARVPTITRFLAVIFDALPHPSHCQLEEYRFRGGDPVTLQFRLFLLEFLQDPLRCPSRSNLTDIQLSEAAFSLLWYIKEEHAKHTPALLEQVSLWAKHSKKAPWLSRRVYGILLQAL